MLIEKANSHAVHDPAWAAHLVERYYSRQLTLWNSTVRYAADLLLRTLSTAPDEYGHEAVLTILFRQAVVSGDAVGALLTVGASDAANVHLRGLAEARWGLMLALQDPVKWGHHLLVASLRQSRHWAATHAPDTPEYEAGKAVHQLFREHGTIRFDADESTRQVASLDRQLSKSQLAPINDAAATYLQRHRREPPWYYDSSAPREEQLTSVFKLAKAVNELAEYNTAYRFMSYYSHGGIAAAHLHEEESGLTAVAHVRTPEGIRASLVYGFSLLADCCRRVTERYRPGELQQFLQQYVEEWSRMIRDCNEVSLSTDKPSARG